MKRLMILAALALAAFLFDAAAFAQSQGSDEAADYALSWRAVGGHRGVPSAYARYGYGRLPYHRR